MNICYSNLNVLLAGNVKREEFHEAVIVQDSGQGGWQLTIPAPKP
jgi:hypothetical protein